MTNMDIYKAWNDYTQLDMGQRDAFIRDTLSHLDNQHELHLMSIVFASDRSASLVIFQEYVTQKIESMYSPNDIFGNQLVNNIIPTLCRDGSEWGSHWDIDKFRIAHDTLNQLHPGLFCLDFYTLDGVLADNHKYENAINKCQKQVESQPVVVSFAIPLAYDMDDQDEFVYMEGYPIQALRRIEMEYIRLNSENMDHLAGDQDQDGLGFIPLSTQLKISDDGRTANFIFTAKTDYDPNQRDSIVKRAQEWLEGQLSDGWGEDMVRHEQLVGNTVLYPFFDVDHIHANIAEAKHNSLKMGR